MYYDLLTSLSQSILFIYIINYCLDKGKISYKKRLVAYSVILSTVIIILPKLFQSIIIGVVLTHVSGLFLIFIFFKENYKKALVSYSLIYSVLIMWLFIFGNVLYGIFKEVLPSSYLDITTIGFMYGSQAILLTSFYTYRFRFKQISKLLSDENFPLKYIIAFSFIPDILLYSYFSSYNIDSPAFKHIVIIILIIFLCISMQSIVRIVKRANEIYKLNNNLASKNTELKNIKHDYGLQMACLYELADMDKYEDVASLLKSIINQYGANMNDNSVSNTSLLSLATRHIINGDVKMILEDKANYKSSTISEIELYRIIVNIVNNAIKAMKNKGTLIAKSFEDLKNIIITIENDGEKIPEEIIDKIFNAGYTTKNNHDKSHGYGLSIVKDLLKSHNGNIFVESNEFITKFTITLPKTTIYNK